MPAALWIPAAAFMMWQLQAAAQADKVAAVIDTKHQLLQAAAIIEETAGREEMTAALPAALTAGQVKTHQALG